MKTLLTLAPQKYAALTDEENVLSRIKMAKDRTAGLTKAMITVITDQSLHQPDKGVTHHTSHIALQTHTHISWVNTTSHCCPSAASSVLSVCQSCQKFWGPSGAVHVNIVMYTPLPAFCTKSYSPSLFRFVSKWNITSFDEKGFFFCCFFSSPWHFLIFRWHTVMILCPKQLDGWWNESTKVVFSLH